MFDPSAAPPQFDPQIRAISDLTRKLRIVEDRMGEVAERVTVTTDSLSKKGRELEEAVTTLLRTLSAVQKDVTVIKTELAQVRKEIGRAATTDKVAELEGYISMIDPMKFVTRDEVKRMIASAEER